MTDGFVYGAATQIDLPHDVVVDASGLAYWLVHVFCTLVSVLF